jgi:methylamine utilization protein MauE
MIAVVVILGALICHLFNYAYFHQKMTTFAPLLSPAVKEHLPLAVMAGELALVAGLCLGRNSRLWHWVVYYSLFLATVYLMFWVTKPWQPDCDCEGLHRLAGRIRNDNILCLVRNVVLMGFLWLGGHSRPAEGCLEQSAA